MQTVSNERGTVIVFVTLVIVFLLIMVGLGLDTGQLTYTRNQGQAAVDAAALAAVSALPSWDAAQVEKRAAGFNTTNTYVESGTNKIGSANVSYIEYDFDSNQIVNYSSNIATANGVRVALEGGTSITTPVFLTPLLNLFGISAAGTADVNVSAVAVIQSKPAIPIALWSSVCPNPDGKIEERQIKFQHPTKSGQGENSCWTTFLDCSSGASDIKALFQVSRTCSGHPIDGEIDIGTYICQNRGQVNSSLKEAADFFTKEAPDFPNRWWLVPVIGGGGNCDPQNPTKIVNWAKIRPKEFNDQGSPKWIRADVVCGEKLNREDIKTSLCFSHKLVREEKKGY
ncbi:MAG TPA: pilus assembly protein TadG-related protein [candidate division Zixibacteria bacterium]|nr:pilus assembly protein TadG-related protein [candidate division Zixibacteria bacterium]